MSVIRPARPRRFAGAQSRRRLETVEPVTWNLANLQNLWILQNL
jgi:hypothetical protein